MPLKQNIKGLKNKLKRKYKSKIEKENQSCIKNVKIKRKSPDSTTTTNQTKNQTSKSVDVQNV